MNTDACANAVIQLIEEESAEMVWTLTPPAVAPFLRSLPDDPSHRAGSAAETFTGIRPVHVGCTGRTGANDTHGLDMVCHLDYTFFLDSWVAQVVKRRSKRDLGDITRQMSLIKQLIRKKNVIIKAWFDGIVASYPADTAQFLTGQKDPFANPVGQTTLNNLEPLIDHILHETAPQTVRDLMDPIIRIRAIQDFTPAKAVGWIFDLKDILRDASGTLDGRHIKELGRLERHIDQLGLLAFDIYMQCREKIYDLKANEVKARTYSAFARAGLIKEPADNDSPAQ